MGASPPEGSTATRRRSRAGVAVAEPVPRVGALGARILAAVIFLPLLCLVALRGGLFFLALIELIILLGLVEYFRLVGAKGIRPRAWLGFAGGLLVGGGMYAGGTPAAGAAMTLVVLAAVAGELLRRDGSAVLSRMAALVLGVAYVAWLLGHLILLRELPRWTGAHYAEGASYVLLVFLVTWSMDTAAYFVGRLCGRRKLLARVSPAKSVEGALGGGAAAIGAALLAKVWFARYLGWGDCLAVGLVAGVLGQIGDLAESLMKRDAGVKDASGIIPGHGGVLDRFDSLIFTAPSLYYLLRYVVLR